MSFTKNLLIATSVLSTIQVYAGQQSNKVKPSIKLDTTRPKLSGLFRFFKEELKKEALSSQSFGPRNAQKGKTKGS